MKLLYRTLNQRKRPEDVAQMIVDIVDFEFSERKIIEKATKNSLKNNLWGYTSMAESFVEPIGAKKQIEAAAKLFEIETSQFNSKNIKSISKFIATVSALINKTVGRNNFISDRQNRSQRKASNIEFSKRAYNKRWRLLTRLESKLLKFTRECDKVEFQKISKHGIIHHVNMGDFLENISSACFVAYYTARCNMRSEFTIQGQQRAFDEISEMLFDRCKRDENTNWYMIAHVYPSVEVLSHISDEQKGALLGIWTTILQNISILLKELWLSNDINRSTMIVKKGNDSTTWNNTAGAWNKARDSWINLIYALGMDDVLDTVCFGKVLRLMAGDVVAWHFNVGNKLDPNTEVWNKLPLPWEVFDNLAICNRELIKKICKKAHIDPEKSGWIAPREHKVVPYRVTPELVHGVTVNNPFLAQVLKQQGFFSGK